MVLLAYEVEASVHTILKTERLALNIMQRMSGIATHTGLFVEAVKGTNAKILDTRKTTPNLRYFEKWAVRIGGAVTVAPLVRAFVSPDGDVREP